MADDYRPRVLDAILDELMTELPAIAIDGPKGVGKTSTVTRRAATTFDLDDVGVLRNVQADSSLIARSPAPVVIDEWHRHPPVWDAVRRAVDADPRPGRFLVTGSASPAAPGVHSGAGRIVLIRMRPMSLAERGVTEPIVSLRTLLSGERGAIEGSTDIRLPTYVEEIAASGFPGLRGLSGRARREALRGYVRLVVDRDVPDGGLAVRDTAALARWLRAYAAATSTTATFETIRDAATSGEGSKPAKTTVIPYRDVLERIWIVDPVPAWSPVGSHLKLLVQGPKHQLADPALAVTLLELTEETLLAGRARSPIPRTDTMLGGLFESLVTLEVRVAAALAEASVHHLRTRGGEREIDLIVVGHDGRVVAIEVKLAEAIDDRDVRHLQWLRGQIGDQLADAVIVTTGRFAYRRPDGIAVVPAALLGP